MAVVATLVVIGIAIPLHTKGDKSEASQIQTNPLSSLSDTSSKEEIIGAIRYIADNMGLDKSQLLTTIQCESSFDNSKIGKAGEIGIAQFMPSTWRNFGCQGQIESIKDQLVCMGLMWEAGMQKHWTCWKNYFLQ